MKKVSLVFFRVSFYDNRYYSNIIATIYPYEGKCECICDGSWHLVDFNMTGTKFQNSIDTNKIIDTSNYNENDMIRCMQLSNYIYGYKEIKAKDNEKTDKEEIIISNNKSFKDVINKRNNTFLLKQDFE